MQPNFDVFTVTNLRDVDTSTFIISDLHVYTQTFRIWNLRARQSCELHVHNPCVYTCSSSKVVLKVRSHHLSSFFSMSALNQKMLGQKCSSAVVRPRWQSCCLCSNPSASFSPPMWHPPSPKRRGNSWQAPGCTGHCLRWENVENNCWTGAWSGCCVAFWSLFVVEDAFLGSLFFL